MAVLAAGGVEDALRFNTPWFAENLLQIVDKGSRQIPLVPNPEQLRFDAALEAQRVNGQPMRAIVLKARKLGFSTWTQAKLIQRVTQFAHHTALVLAQDKRTAADLFRMSELMYNELPDDVLVKPEKAYGRKGLSLELRNLAQYQVDTAKEFQAGRGLTLHSLHGSEVAFWPDIKQKLTGLLNAVPSEEPNTLVVLESTAFGHNYFKELWDQAEAGENGYIPFFSPWFHDSGYRRPFDSLTERDGFRNSIGEGQIGEDEPGLIELGVSLEQLHWRRWKFNSPEIGQDINTFRQEYPATPDEAFGATGRRVFNNELVSRAMVTAKATVPVMGRLLADRTAMKRAHTGQLVEVPVGAKWHDGGVFGSRQKWLVWQHPEPAGQYIIGVDVAGDEEDQSGQGAWHAIQVVDHKTRLQVAEYSSQEDRDLLALQVFLAAVYWNRAWVAVEITGGWGGPINRKLRHTYGHPLVYRRKPLDKTNPEQATELLGWQTDTVTRPHMIDHMREMLREGRAGVMSPALVGEMRTFVHDKRGKPVPEPGKFSDRLMAYMIAQLVAQEKVVRPDRDPDKPRVTSTSRFAVANPKAGW